MSVPPKNFSLTYSLADQSFQQTKSLGILNVSLGLLHALVNRAECAPLTVLANESLKDVLRVPPATCIVWHNAALRGKLGRIGWDQTGVYSAAKHVGSEWLFLPKGFAPFLRRCPARLAVFIHDVMQEHYDRCYPDAVSAFEAAYFRAGFRASLRQAEVIFTPTEFTRREIARVAAGQRLPLPRLVCCGEGVSRPANTSARERRGLLVLAGQFPHKLTRTAADYLSRWQSSTDFAEETNWVGALPAGLELPAFRGWRRHTRLPEPEFREMVGRVRAVLFFSDYEGFGLPPVEAALAGACPVYSELPATSEVMEGRGCAFGNDDYESFAAALNRALSTPPEQIARWGEELLERHNWSAVAERVIAGLQTAES
ncbi:MAG: hypothetical protein HY300_18710 [Verrucomicrobia bacterium]|nr:hypothetical protein [Verrucomicrobiota bacterium]